MAVKVGDGEQDVMADINITPFTDVLLVLLIIFMVAATAVVQNGFNINLPKQANETTPATPDDKNIIVSIAVPDKISVNSQPAERDNLEALLHRLKENKNTDRIIIMAEDDVEYSQVIWVMDTAKAAGLPGIAMAAQPKSGAAPK